jgi:hypothetical protein
VYSGHNGYADWGPPPASKRVVIAVGLGSPAALAPYATGCELKARV